MKNITYRLVLLLFLLNTATSYAEPVLASWEYSDVIQPGQSFRDPNLRTVIISTGPEGVQLVNQNSDPVSPFPNGEPALRVQSTLEAPFWFRLNFRPFDDPDVRAGVAEFDLRPVDGHLMIQVGNQPAPWDPASNDTYYVAKVAFSISLQSDEPPAVAARALETDSITHIIPDTNYRVTIKWDFSSGEPQCRIFLNGEMLRLQRSAEPFTPPISPEAVAAGINTFRVSLGSPENHIGETFVGTMRAASGFVPDLDQADESVFEQ